MEGKAIHEMEQSAPAFAPQQPSKNCGSRLSLKSVISGILFGQESSSIEACINRSHNAQSSIFYSSRAGSLTPV